MAASVWTGLREQPEFLRRLSIAFGVELRLRILTELYLREMSPKQFCEECGGGSVSRVASHFKVLQEHGWLRLVRTETGGGRRGGEEHFYRTRELAIFDLDSWSLLPFSLRVGYSWMTLKQYSEKVREAVKAGTFDSRVDWRHQLDSVQLDVPAWGRVVAAAGDLFSSFFEEQVDAGLRMDHSAEEPTLTTAALFAFESPLAEREHVGPILVEGPESPYSLPLRLSKVLGDEVALRILAVANEREVSAKQILDELGGDGNAIHRRFKRLERMGWLTLTDQKTGGHRRGATEKFYRATGPVLAAGAPRPDEPASAGGGDGWAVFERTVDAIVEAMKAGTFDASPERCATWSLLRLDRQGRKSVAASIDRLHALLHEEAKNAEGRLEESGERPIRMSVASALFESPPPPKEP